MFSKALFHQTAKANWIKWVAVTLATCIMLAIVIIVLGNLAINDIRDSLKDVFTQADQELILKENAVDMYDLYLTTADVNGQMNTFSGFIGSIITDYDNALSQYETDNGVAPDDAAKNQIATSQAEAFITQWGGIIESVMPELNIEDLKVNLVNVLLNHSANPDLSSKELLLEEMYYPEVYQNAYALEIEEGATEADAMAHECAAAHEMKKDLPQVWNQFKQKHAGIAAAYESFADQPDKALGEAFKAWHDNQKYVSKYDQNTLDQLAFDAGRSGFDFLKNSIPGEEIGEQICKKDGKSYLEKGFMTSARALIVDERTVWPKVIRVKQAAIEATNHRDSSDEELYTRAPDGTVVSRRTAKSSEKQQSVDNAAGKKCAGLSGSPSDIKNRLTAIKRRTSGR